MFHKKLETPLRLLFLHKENPFGTESLSQRPPHKEIFPDFVRRLVLESLPMVADWSFTQTESDHFRLDLATPGPPTEAIDNFRQGWISICTARGARPGNISLGEWSPPAPGAKLRRVIGLPSD